MDAIDELYKIFRRKGSIDILLYIAEKGSARYSELKKIIDNEPSLIRSLKVLCEYKYLTRRILDDKYRPTEYEITEKGKVITEYFKGIIKIINIQN